MNEENQAIIKALNMYGRVPEQWELLNEIERLNNIINEFEVWLNDKYEEMHDIWYVKILNKLKELKGVDKE